MVALGWLWVALTNLVNWVPVADLANPGGVVEFIDSGASSVPQRFYRAACAQP